MSAPIFAAVGLLACMGSALVGYSHGHQTATKAVELKWTADRLQRSEDHAEELKLARKQSDQLQALADRLRKEKTHEINRIALNYQSVVDGLRERPETRAGAGGVPTDAGSGTGCTGEGLARPDAGFLAGYAADAARLQAAFNLCRQARTQSATEVN